MKKLTGYMASAAVGAMLVMSGPAHAVSVGTELGLLLDISGSISAGEYNLQREGYAQAFEDAAVQTAIESQTGGIAVNMVMWAGSASQSQVVAWRQIQTGAEADQLAADIRIINRPFGGQTAPQSAMNYEATAAGVAINANGFEGATVIVDVSGDGVRNDGLGGTVGRDALVAAGVDRINGLVIGGSAAVLAYYVNNVQAGAGSFVVAAADFAAFGAAIKDKILTEVSGVPIPGAVWLFGTGLACIFGFARRRKMTTA